MIPALIIADILMISSFLLRFSHLPPEIPLFYSHTWGEDQLADFWYIFLLPLCMHLFIFLNNYIYNTFFSQNEFIKKILTSVNWFLIIVLTILFLKIVFFIT